MQPLTRTDPAPSRLRYRAQRMMLTPLYRTVLRVVLPLVLAFGGAAGWLYHGDNAERIALAWADTKAMIRERPEFMVRLMAVDGASGGVAEAVRAELALNFPVSSFDLDLDAMRQTVTELPAVKSARLRVRKGGMLQIEIVERVPVVLWRTQDGLAVLDDEGVTVAYAESRRAHPRLPVIAGAGADRAVTEAVALHEAAAPIGARLRGFVRKGERRWDAVLDRGQRIMLPEKGAVRALERAIAMDEAVDLLARDLVAVDLRLPQRPTLRMTDHALKELWRIKDIEAGENG